MGRIKQLVEGWEHSLDPIKGPGWFLLATAALSVGGNALYDLTTSYTGQRRIVLALIAFACFVVLLFAIRVIRRLYQALLERQRTRREIPTLGDATVVGSRSALVVFVSGRDAHEVALRYHLQHSTLRTCWVVSSTTPEMLNKANEFAASMKSKHPAIAFPVFPIRDVNDLKMVHHDYLNLLGEAQRSFASQEVVVDVTGGTAIVTSGAIVACLQQGVDAEYIKQGTTPPEIIKVDVQWIEQAGDSRQGSEETE